MVVELIDAVKSFILKEGEHAWPPRSAKHSVRPAIDVEALNAFIRGDEPSGMIGELISDVSGQHDHAAGAEPIPELDLVVRNEFGETERVAELVDDFADRLGFPQQDRFQLQLIIEETLVHIIERNLDGDRPISLRINMDEEGRNISISTEDHGSELEFTTLIFQPSPDTIEEETVAESIGLHLVGTYVDHMRYRREDGVNHLSLKKRIGI